IVDHGQLRGFAWSLRELANAAFATPDSDPMKSYFTTLLDNNLNELSKNFLSGGAMEATGQLQGWIPDYPNGGVEPPWQNDFMATALSEMVHQGFSQASPLANWMINFEAGRFLNGANGFDPIDGSAYHLNLWAPDPASSFPTTGDPGTKFYSTWAEVASASLADGNIGPIGPNPDMSAFAQAEYYPMYARGALASLFTATGQPDALAAFGV